LRPTEVAASDGPIAFTAYADESDEAAQRVEVVDHGGRRETRHWMQERDRVFKPDAAREYRLIDRVIHHH
jgi:hypothetical protein